MLPYHEIEGSASRSTCALVFSLILSVNSSQKIAETYLTWVLTPMSAFEQHYKPEQVAKLWGFSTPTIRSLFEREEGVLIINHPETRNKRGYKSMRIPGSVVARVAQSLSARRKR